MSVLQVMSSSKVGNALYFAAGSIIASIYLNTQDFLFSFSVETALVVVPFGSLVGAMLWATELERHLIEGLVKQYVNRSSHGKRIRKRISLCILLMKPWRYSVKEEKSIKSTLAEESIRVVRSINLRPDMERISQLFWLNVIILGFLYLFGAESEFSWVSWLPIALLITLTMSSAVLWQKRKQRFLIPWLALSTWILDTDGISRRRTGAKSVFRARKFSGSDMKQIEGISVLSKEILTLSRAEDWIGALKAAESFDEYIESVLEGFKVETIDEFWNQIIWFLSYEDDPIAKAGVRSLMRLLSNVCSEITPDDTDSVQALIKDSLSIATNEISYSTKIDEGFSTHDLVSILDTFMIGKMSASVIQDILSHGAKDGRLPDGCKVIPAADTRKIQDTAKCVILLVEQGYPHAFHMLRALEKWYPVFDPRYLSKPNSYRIVLERSVGLSDKNVVKLLKRVFSLGIDCDWKLVAETLSRNLDDPKDKVYKEVKETLEEGVKNNNKQAIALADVIELVDDTESDVQTDSV